MTGYTDPKGVLHTPRKLSYRAYAIRPCSSGQAPHTRQFNLDGPLGVLHTPLQIISPVILMLTKHSPIQIFTT
jgi:hypothetical protein